MFDAADTTPEAEAVMRANLLRAGAGGRLALALRLSDEVRRLAVVGATLRAERRQGGDPEAEVRRMYLGDAAAELVEAWQRKRRE